MTAFLLRRFAVALLSLWAAATVVFVVLAVLPGDPALIVLGVNARPDTLAALRAEMGLDRPLLAQYAGWLAGLATLDLGTSTTYATPVTAMISERLPLTLPLALLAILISTAVAIPLGVLAAANRGGPLDTVAMAGSQLGVAVPNFWFGLLLILLFAVGLGWLPAGGFAGWERGIGPALASLAMPALALALPQAAILARVTRSAMLEVLTLDYMRTARAKGLSKRRALWRHGLRNALIPVVTIMGLQFSFLLSGTIIIENVFNLPGLGRLIFQAIAQRDLIVVQSLVVVLVAAVIAINLIVDLLYVALDPRLRRPA